LIPPAALHHFTNASPTWKNSLPSPGAIEDPASDIVPMLMAVLLMPRPVPPVAVPGPQIPFRSPKSPAALVLAVADADPLGALLGGVEEDDPDRPHAANASNVVVATAAVITTARGRRVLA
jgi:hypothetical protein